MNPNQTQVRSGLGALTIAALGIVYGDIGTSPLYAFKEAFNGPHALVANVANVLATLSALFWSITLIISIKYVWVVLNFNNAGEGGVLALTALASRFNRRSPRTALVVTAMGVFAATLFYGDAIITPAISVLSAVEGLSVATPAFERLIIPITLGVLAALFYVQRFGTGRVGMLFGPITGAWFLVIGALGAASIAQTPSVLQAINPMYAVDFAVQRPAAMFILLSAVFLALTGGEALYADMGHFGAKAVRIAWYGLVCPALLLNYFGQGALVLRDPSAIKNPFYLMVSDSWLLPLVALATMATVIASQATISGAFSLTQQASRLGYLPRLNIRYTSDQEKGQIYIPSVNWIMMVAVFVVVIQFKTSSALAAAYGVAVSATMVITSLLALSVITGRREIRHRISLVAAFGLFMFFELAFLFSNLSKFFDGGWFPVALGVALFGILVTWNKGSKLMAAQRGKLEIPVTDFVEMFNEGILRVPGTGVYLTSDPKSASSALFHALKHFKSLHERIVLVHVETLDVPYVEASQRARVEVLKSGLYAVTLSYGFREQPDIAHAILELAFDGVRVNPLEVSYFIARSTIASAPGGMHLARRSLFTWLARQADSAGHYYKLPPNQVVELGTQVHL